LGICGHLFEMVEQPDRPIAKGGCKTWNAAPGQVVALKITRKKMR
jgi:hypothetical protein